MDPGAIRDRATQLPDEPGVYLFRSEKSVLYVGKAVDLRSRVLTYADPRSDRIDRMVTAADEIEIAITDTETQALLLEANLIKRHAPRFNVRLTDDKSYPLVQLTDHAFPRIEITRDPSEGATVWGPFTHVGQLQTIVKAIRDIFGIRGCSDHKYRNRDRPCLDYDIGLCAAPCTNEIDEQGYSEAIRSVEQFFDGATGILADPIESAMETAAANHQYERAATLRDRLTAVREFHGGGADVVRHVDDRLTVDVLGVALEGTRSVVARLRSDGGKLIDRDQHRLDGPSETAAEVLAAFIPQFFTERELPDRILCSHPPEDEELLTWLASEGVELRMPKSDRESRLIDLALKNARRGVADGVNALVNALDLEAADRIEGFDVSHAQGRDTVGSNVLFVDGQPEKSGYRRKRLSQGNDDYAAMRELIMWRATRAQEGRDDRDDPDVLVIDGGKGQLSAATEALSETGWGPQAIALAKGDEQVITPNGDHNWSSKDAQLHLLQQIRDEAHRFAVQYHRTRRDSVESVLDDVPGIGPELRTRLLRRFGSVNGIRSASITELRSVDGIGETTAETIARRV